AKVKLGAEFEHNRTTLVDENTRKISLILESEELKKGWWVGVENVRTTGTREYETRIIGGIKFDF
ncbi:hypothetical protein KJ780_03330, partial [Candidatus Micrarchaeota archaeon]|nr:hypothetical protein [Candidatus Micrarchaeota archaeon]